MHYIRTWFALDLLTAMPIDIILFVLERCSGIVLQAGLARVVRLTRLIKLFRLARISRIFARWQASIGLSYAVTSLVQFLLLTLILAHWLACLWGFVGRNSGDGTLTPNAPRDPLNQSWIEKAGLVMMFRGKAGGDFSSSSSTSNATVYDDEDDAEEVDQLAVIAGAFRLYGASLYVSLNNIFGGSCELSPANYVEYYVHCLMMLVGSAMWAYIIGSGCGIISTLNPERVEYRQTMDQVNYFARSRRLPPHLTWRLRNFFHSTQHIFHAKRFDTLLDKMSGSLRADVCSHVARAVLTKVPYFKESEVEGEFLAAVALCLKPRVYCPREVVRTDELVIVERGILVRSGTIYLTGMCVGEDMIVSRPAFRDHQPAIALAFLHVATLERSALDELLSSFPRARACVRRAALRIATRRAFIMAAKKIRDSPKGALAAAPPPSSTRSGERVLLAVAPMQSIVAERAEEAERLAEQARNAVAKRLNEQWNGTDERVAVIERRTDEIGRVQRAMEAQVERMGETLRAELREIGNALMVAAATGKAPSMATATPLQLAMVSDVSNATPIDGGSVSAAAVSLGGAAAAVGGGNAIRRRVNNLARVSPCTGGVAPAAAAAIGARAGSKELAPSMRRTPSARMVRQQQQAAQSGGTVGGVASPALEA